MSTDRPRLASSLAYLLTTPGDGQFSSISVDSCRSTPTARTRIDLTEEVEVR